MRPTKWKLLSHYKKTDSSTGIQSQSFDANSMIYYASDIKYVLLAVEMKKIRNLIPTPPRQVCSVTDSEQDMRNVKSFL